MQHEPFERQNVANTLENERFELQNVANTVEMAASSSKMLQDGKSKRNPNMGKKMKETNPQTIPDRFQFATGRGTVVINKGIDSTFRNKVQEKKKKFSLLFFIEELYYWSAPQHQWASRWIIVSSHKLPWNLENLRGLSWNLRVRNLGYLAWLLGLLCGGATLATSCDPKGDVNEAVREW
jgi:hypothetical protein